jgi:CHAD domain-containing protein
MNIGMRPDLACRVAFALKPGKSIKRQLIRMARKELGRGSRCLLTGHGGMAVHEARKGAKKAEAILLLLDRLGFAVPRKDERRLRTARRALSILRDADALIETFDDLRSRYPNRIPQHTAALVRAHLQRARDTSDTRAATVGRLPQVALALRSIRRSARGWAVPPVDPQDLPSVIARAYRASRKAMNRARERRRMDDFHLWRKRVKTLWNQLRLAGPLMPGTAATIKRLKDLEAALGEEHNLAVLRVRLSGDWALGRLSSNAAAKNLAAARQRQLRRDALAMGHRLLADSPKQFNKILRRRLRAKQSTSDAATPRRSRAA